MHWQKLTSEKPQQTHQQRPYLGVRVKEPVKELLKRKRGSFCSTISSTPSVTSTYQTYPTYTSVVSNPTDLQYIDMDATTSALPVHDEGTLYTGWISQPSTASFPPLTQWTACPEYLSHETVSCPYTGDMYVQPMCQGYTVVGAPSVLTYTSQPLITNFTTRSVTPGITNQMEYIDQQAPLTYFPWTQSIPTLPAAPHSLQYQATPPTLQGPQLVPIPISLPVPAPQEQDETRRDINNISIEKLLQEANDSESYVLNQTLEGL
ncbi:POU domain class 2-associating factor 1 [Bombina bombina]|uniref:POU domain class 2-associating factor 1 n=1 Tax=Bombina bombina TaxID=8345 RepID=UPI00235B235E|nr:POU domain class 2-associating factor 1 [Bombina bombina]